jgi:hypothetical protein
MGRYVPRLTVARCSEVLRVRLPCLTIPVQAAETRAFLDVLKPVVPHHEVWALVGSFDLW